MPDGHLFISAICTDQGNEHFLSIHIMNMFSIILSFYVFTLYFAKSEYCFDLIRSHLAKVLYHVTLITHGSYLR